MRRAFAWLGSSPALPWAALFLVLSLAVTQLGGTNALSRAAALRAITEGHTLSIDDYRDWTIDWALSPNGHYYSNKAPGPVLLGLPMFALTDAFALPLAPVRDERGRAPQPSYVQHVLLMLWLQLLPFSVLVLYASRRLLERGAPPAAAHFFALAAFFGNTAALYMGTNFGHGLASLLFLAAFLSWCDRRYVLTGLFLSWSLLSDYGVAFTLPFFLLGTLWRERKPRPLAEIAAGALPGAAVWVWYHVSCFGSPFRTATLFTNPEQLDAAPGGARTLSVVPSAEILARLLFGSSRGLLFTQPWALAAFALPFVPSREKGLALVITGSLAGLLWMNGGFGGWHGGWCLGPRYLSAALPALALALALSWRQFGRAGRALLWASLGGALLFRVLVYPFSNLAPQENLWLYHLGLYASGAHRGTVFLRLGIALVSAALALLWWRKRSLTQRDSGGEGALR